MASRGPKTATVTLSLPTPCVTSALAATAHNNSLLTAAQFDHISLLPPVPPAPAGLSATAGDAQVVLDWSAASGATSYNLKRSTTSGSGYATIDVRAGLTFTDTAVSNGTTYYYVVSAVNAGEKAPRRPR